MPLLPRHSRLQAAGHLNVPAVNADGDSTGSDVEMPALDHVGGTIAGELRFGRLERVANRWDRHRAAGGMVAFAQGLPGGVVELDAGLAEAFVRFHGGSPSKIGARRRDFGTALAITRVMDAGVYLRRSNEGIAVKFPPASTETSHFDHAADKDRPETRALTDMVPGNG